MFSILLLSLLAPLQSFAIPSTMDITVSLDKGARMRVKQIMPVNGENSEVLVVERTIPKGSVVRVDLNPLQYRWIINNQNKIVMSGPPFFAVQVLSTPFTTLDFSLQEKILATPYFATVGDIDPAAIVSTLFPEALPSGVERVDFNAPWDRHNPTGTWSYTVNNTLKKAGISNLINRAPSDIVDFCPRYSQISADQRRYVWISMAALVADLESEFVPLDATDEGQYNSAMKGVISAGLLQLSIDSVGSPCYVQRGCNIHTNPDLFDPTKNLECGIAIMSCLAESAGCVSCKVKDTWQGVARYWSTLRDPYWVECPTCAGGKVQVGHRKDIQEELKTLTPFCF